MSIETADKYVAHVRKQVKENPGRRSALRRSLGRPVEDDLARKAHSVVAPWLPTDRPPRAVEQAYYSVAALIAAQPRGRADQHSTDTGADPGQETAAAVLPLTEQEPAGEPEDADQPKKKTGRQTTSLGSTLGRAVVDKKLTADTVEARLHLLCRQNVPGLHRHLPGLVRRLATAEVEPDWGRLLRDLSRWEGERGQVTKWWLQDFYRAINKTEHPAPTDGDTIPEGEDQ
ncbi:type I-E CRISPR-associated protein Cse2/CasB [Acrocarpospora catenulata]|uniref:type I-E CRISPR-associated protein Cse2/CasB n=1 Tax=Acrocarpospora catenulata TaxID=2836182 RepID=UPI001BDAB003|nr:type I-E CRISPR-associated protein Cse2/CasB [Acrocarpospora catenulata]